MKHTGAFYMCGNDGPLFKADSPLGPFTKIGDWQNTPDVAGGWNGTFDMELTVFGKPAGSLPAAEPIPGVP